MLEFALSGESQSWRILSAVNQRSGNRTGGRVFKEERIITSAQQADITVADGATSLTFVPTTISDWRIIRIYCGGKGGNGFSRFRHGFGAFICGTQDSHKELEQKLAAFLGWKMRFSTLPALMLTVACLKPAERGGRHYLRRTEPRVYY